MKSVLHTVESKGEFYEMLSFWCPGCEVIDKQGERQAGLHMLPVNCSPPDRASWTWDGNLEAPTLSPSILSSHAFYRGEGLPPRSFVCHSFLRAGVFDFLGDCTHQLAGQQVPIPDLPEWAAR